MIATILSAVSILQRGPCLHQWRGTLQLRMLTPCFRNSNDDVIKRKHFPRYWPFVRGIHRSPVNSPHKGQWRGALMFSLICVWINGWVKYREAGDLRLGYRAHYDVIVMREAWKGHSTLSCTPEYSQTSYSFLFRSITGVASTLNYECYSHYNSCYRQSMTQRNELKYAINVAKGVIIEQTINPK